MNCDPSNTAWPAGLQQASIIALLFALSACGGGGSKSEAGQDSLPEVSIAGGEIDEGDTGVKTLEFTASLTKTSSDEISVDFATSDGSAAAGTDYRESNGRLRFAAGESMATVAVEIIGDTEIELTETFFVALSAPVNAELATRTAVGEIENDDFTGNGPGLDARLENLTCVAPPRPNDDASVSIGDPFPAIATSQPTKILLEPAADPRWFVLQKGGQLLTFDPDNANSTRSYLDLSGVVRTANEGGLLGMAFHPDYPATPEIFLSYTIDHGAPPMRSVVSRFILDDTDSPGGGTVEQVLLQVDQDADNHNGGDIAFGPDGYLYIGLGDGGGANDPHNRAQDTRYLLGSMLRIDVTGGGVSFPGNPYDIPAGNPFAGNAECGPGVNADDCPEIFAWGLRNPWRWSFDDDSESLWVGDVGQDAYEEVDLVENGGNYGWRCREGAHGSGNGGSCDGFIDPVSEYPHGLGNSITGGFVYRGSAISELIGRYVFADFASGRFWALRPDGSGGYENDELIDSGFNPSSFGVGEDGELYFSDFGSGRIRRLEPAGAPGADTIADRLSDSGCTDPDDVTLPYAGLVPFDINAAFWSDGADKQRYIGLPDGATITRTATGDWEFPNGTVIVKNFLLDDRLVETRHLMRHPDGEWAGYTYQWNAQQTEARRIRGGKIAFIDGQDWIFPAESQCLECHTAAAGFTLGLETAQLNRLFTYPSTGRRAQQLETFDHLLMFSSPLASLADDLPRLHPPDDAGADLDLRARAYLHTNCSQCHRQGGPTPAAMDFRFSVPLASSSACDALPQLGDLGIANARIIAPGDADRSVLIARDSRRDSRGMPPLGSGMVHAEGVDLLRDWINGLSGCNP